MFRSNRNYLIFLIFFSLILPASICKPHTGGEKIWVSVCSDFPDLPPDQARIANPYCPSRLAQYLKSNQPTEICTKHTKPEPPIPQCDIPWPTTHKLLIWSGLLLCDLSTKDNEEFQESDLDDYYDALAMDGVNVTRSFAFFLDEQPGYWESWKPVDAEYAAHFTARLKLITERKLTAVVSLWAYGGGSTDSEIDYIVDLAKPFLPYVIFEMQNESPSMYEQRRIIFRCKELGIPSSAILINFNDSGDFADCLQNELGGEGLACGHGVGSMETINQPGVGWSTSAGCLTLMKLGLFPSSDGEDATHSAKGYFWFWLPPPGPGRRPSTEQIYEITKWCLVNGRGWEHLSASGFQNSGRPNLKKAIELGREERRAMRRAYDER